MAVSSDRDPDLLVDITALALHGVNADMRFHTLSSLSGEKCTLSLILSLICAQDPYGDV